MHPLTLDTLRQPLESGYVEVHRAAAVAKFPARFLLVLAANPCPCGLVRRPQRASATAPPDTRTAIANASAARSRTASTSSARSCPAARGEGEGDRPESTAEVAARVQARPRPTGPPLREQPAGHSTARSPARSCAGSSRSTKPSQRLLEDHYSDGRLTARGFDRVSRLAWTLADLDGSPSPNARPDPRSLPTPHRRAPHPLVRHPPSQRTRLMTPTLTPDDTTSLALQTVVRRRHHRRRPGQHHSPAPAGPAARSPPPRPPSAKAVRRSAWLGSV